MPIFKIIRTESHSTLEFQPADKLGFSTETVDDYNIQQSLTDLKGHCNAGRLIGIPADASAADLREAVYNVVGAEKHIAMLQANVETVKAAREAGTPVFDALMSFTRVFEQGDGKGRTGRKRAAFAGLGEATDESPLV